MNKRGFTLVEVLLASAIFVIAVSTFGYLLNQAQNSVSTIDDLSRALYIARSKVEEIRNIPFDQLLVLNGSTFFEGKGKILIVPVLADLTRIQVELKWNPNRTPIRIHSLRSKYL